MFLFKKKTPLQLQIELYGKDQDTLLEFAKFIQKPHIEEITHEDIKRYYTSLVEPQNSHWRRDDMMKAVRKFFRYYRGENILKADLVSQRSLQSVENIAMIEPMPKVIEKKRGPGRPRDIASIKKVVALRNEGIPFRQIALALKKDVSQIWVWWDDREKLLS